MIAENLKLRGIDSSIETARSLSPCANALKPGEQQDNVCL
jgi:hypothetical protein